MEKWVVRCNLCQVEMIPDELLGEKIWKCPKCGFIVGRKEQAEENIKVLNEV